MKLSLKRWRRRSLRSLPLTPRDGSITAVTRSRFNIYECCCKTAAFAIPLIEGLDRKGRGVQELVLAPTRELAAQAAAEISNLSLQPGPPRRSLRGRADRAPDQSPQEPLRHSRGRHAWAHPGPPAAGHA